jgi:hypothetical protein
VPYIRGNHASKWTIKFYNDVQFLLVIIYAIPEVSEGKQELHKFFPDLLVM